MNRIMMNVGLELNVVHLTHWYRYGPNVDFWSHRSIALDWTLHKAVLSLHKEMPKEKVLICAHWDHGLLNMYINHLLYFNWLTHAQRSTPSFSKLQHLKALHQQSRQLCSSTIVSIINNITRQNSLSETFVISTRTLAQTFFLLLLYQRLLVAHANKEIVEYEAAANTAMNTKLRHFGYTPLTSLRYARLYHKMFFRHAPVLNKSRRDNLKKEALKFGRSVFNALSSFSSNFCSVGSLSILRICASSMKISCMGSPAPTPCDLYSDIHPSLHSRS